MTALVSDLMGGAGAPSALATLLGEEIIAVTASGTIQLSRAASIVAGNNLGMGFNTVTTSGGNTAVQLMDSFPVGRSTFVNVTSATSALVYPPDGCTIQGGSLNAAITVGQNSPVQIFRVSRTAFIGLTAVTSTGGTGTVTSVTFTGDGTVLSSTPSAAVTTSGTLSASLATQAANRVLAGPTTGAAAAPTFRALVVDDLPPGTAGSVTSVASGTGLAGGPITSSGTLTVDQTPAIVTAAGTVQGDATAITALINVVTTTPAGSGVILPASSALFNRRIVNHGANSLNIYPNSGGTINGLSANTAITIASGGVSVLLVTADGTAWWVA